MSEAGLDEAIWDRLEEALKEYELRHRAALRESQGRLTQTEIGKRVARLLGLAAAIPQPAVAKWFNRATLPGVARLVALALTLEVDPGWLVCGDYSLAPRRAPESGLDTDQYAEWAAVEVERMARELAKGNAPGGALGLDAEDRATR